jgi:hypothetical protein
VPAAGKADRTPNHLTGISLSRLGQPADEQIEGRIDFSRVNSGWGLLNSLAYNPNKSP